ncbi:MAG: amidohydrolase family protein [Ignavibacteriales bacterium]|nr:amidohydrolase family protein [Ignavibacteriales bacterium]
MKKATITIENAWICPVIGEEILPLFGDITIANGMISKIRPKNFQTYLKNPEKVGKDSFNASGKVLTLPLVNFHDHIYSRLAKGLPLQGEFNNFQNVLHNLWWKLDRLLDNEMIVASAQMAAIESIRNGVTYIFDHHSSQNQIKGSLGLIKNALHTFDLRGVLCFESTDRNGTEQAIAGLNENKDFFTSQLNGDFHGMLGLHASFTLSDDLLSEAHKIQNQFDLGIHIHVAEDESDNKLSVEYAGSLPVSRLKKYKLMNDKSILVHGVHLKGKDFIKVSTGESALAFCPDSNLNNSVGLPQFGEIPKNIPFLVGTDGMHSNIAKSIKQLFLLSRGQGNSFDEATAVIKKTYFDQLAFAKKYFSDFPSLNEGDRADMIIWDYVPPTPMSKENFWGHFIYGILEYPVNSVLQKGEFLMKDFHFMDANENKIKNEIYIQGERLVNKLKQNTVINGRKK